MALKLKALEFSYEKTGFSIGPIDLEIVQGTTCLVGANGAGKSTLFSLITNERKPRAGEITFDETPIGSSENLIGFLPQEPIFPARATVEDFLMFCAWARNVVEPQMVVDRVLGAVGLETKRASPTMALSGGMRRRLGIAQALIHAPEILLLDEPTAGLDPKQRLAVRAAIKDHVVGSTTLISTHLVEDVKALADRVIIISNGVIVFQGTVSELESLDDLDLPGESALERAVGGFLESEEDD